jgi:glycosyltransferase involved in cell wall biosynthesis
LLLDQALDRILAQTYDNIEIIVVDDGSHTAAAHAYLTNLETSKYHFPLKVIRSENRYLGAARNLAASHAKGEYILFHDDDNLAEPHEIEAFVSAAINSNADILTSLSCFFTSPSQIVSTKKPKLKFYPIGIGGTFSFFRNRFGDANALVRRTVFEDMGGFTELYGVGWEDWELFLKAYLKGYHLAVVPEPLFFYRTSPDGMLATGNPLKNVERLFQAVKNIKPKMSDEIFRLALGVQVRQEVLDKTWNTLGRERESDLHQQLMAKDPNSEDARIMLSDLAFAIGRFDDALRLAMKHREKREKLSVLVGAARARSAHRPRSIATQTVYPVDRRDILFMNGWTASKSKGPLHFDCLLVDQEWFELLHSSRYPRADVSAHLSLKSEIDLGFKIFAQSNSKLKNIFQKFTSKLFNIPLGNKGNFANIQLSIKDSDAAGHVDAIQWLRYFQIAELDGDRHCSIDVETSAPSQTAIMWLPGTLELGERLSATRTRFSRPYGLLTANAPRLILPSDERSDIAVTQAS